MIRCVALCVALVALVRARSSGAPSSCVGVNSLNLGSDHTQGVGTNGYALSTAATTYQPSAPLTVSLAGAQSWKVILIAAFTSAGANVGVWSSANGLHGGAFLTHSSAASKGPSASFSWTPPTSGAGSITFKAYVATGYGPGAHFYLDNQVLSGDALST